MVQKKPKVCIANMKQRRQKYIEITSPLFVGIIGILTGAGSRAKAAALVPFIITDGSLSGAKKEAIINHELIHFRQQIETLFIGHILISMLEFLYCRLVLRKSAWQTYLFHAEEQEAYANMYDPLYLRRRKPFAHLRNYFVKKPVSSEEIHKKILLVEGFAHVYAWKDEPGTFYPPHAHRGKVALFIERGSIIFNFDHRSILLREGGRIDVPPGEIHRATVGSDGCEFVVGEEIEGDS